MGARDEERARVELMRAAGEFEAACAYRDAATMARRALELWPETHAPDERVSALESHGSWAEFAGDLAEAARSWRELTSLGEARQDDAAIALAQRRLGRVFALQGRSLECHRRFEHSRKRVRGQRRSRLGRRGPARSC